MKENDFTLKKAWSWWYPAETIADEDYVDDRVLLVNTPTQTESLQPAPRIAAGGIGLLVNINKTEYLCFNKEGAIFYSK